RPPFFGDCIGEPLVRDNQGGSRRSPHRPSVELDAPALTLRRDRNVLPEALHSRSASRRSQSFFNIRGANRASIAPRIATIAPTCGHPPWRSRLVYIIAIPRKKIASPPNRTSEYISSRSRQRSSSAL